MYLLRVKKQVCSMDLKQMVSINRMMFCLTFGSAAVPGDVKIVDQNGDGIIDLRIELLLATQTLTMCMVLI